MFESKGRVARAATILLIISSLASSAALARGGFGGFGGGGMRGGSFGGFGGDRSWGGGGDRSGGGGGDRSWGGGGDRSWGGGGDRSWGGGGDRSWGGGDNGVRNWGNGGVHPTPGGQGWRNQPISTDGGFGRFANHQNFNNYGHIGNNTYNINRNTLVNNGNIVRGNFNHYGAFNNEWWGAHPGCWYGGWGASACWYPTTWAVMAPFLGMTSGMMLGMGIGALAGGGGGGGNQTTVVTAPAPYDYGNTIIYEGDNVYYGSQPVATASQYYDQASTLAQSGAPQLQNSGTPKPDDWKPFGVFSLVQQGQSDSTTLFQIAVNKDGVIKGNYYNTLTDETKQITGAIDKKTMRACWTVDGVKNVVYDTGVANLMDSQSSILVHFGKKKTEQFMLVRLQQQQADQMKSSSKTSFPPHTF